jgi:hypothetical protein
MAILIPLAIILLVILGIYVYRKYYHTDLSNYDGDNHNLVTFKNPLFKDPHDMHVDEEFDNVNSVNQTYYENTSYDEKESMA